MKKEVIGQATMDADGVIHMAERATSAKTGEPTDDLIITLRPGDTDYEQIQHELLDDISPGETKPEINYTPDCPKEEAK